MFRKQLLLCYSLGWLSGLLTLIICRDSPRLKHHGLQALLLFGSLDLICAAARIAGLHWGQVNLQAITALFMVWLTVRAVTALFWLWALIDAWHGLEPGLPGDLTGMSNQRAKQSSLSKTPEPVQ